MTLDGPYVFTVDGQRQQLRVQAGSDGVVDAPAQRCERIARDRLLAFDRQLDQQDDAFKPLAQIDLAEDDLVDLRDDVERHAGEEWS